MEERAISRREFVVGTVAAGALATVGLSGCSAQNLPNQALPEEQERESALDTPDENLANQEPKGATEPNTTPTEASQPPAVYMTTDISPESLMAAYEALGRSATGKVAVKVSTGEPGGKNFLSPDLIKLLVQSVEGTIVECNTAYNSPRYHAVSHLQVAEDHGFTAIAAVDIMDADGSISLAVEGGTNLTENFVGSHFADYDFFVILSHFKGHGSAGFGGAIKNASIGIASSEGKAWIHSAGASKTSLSADQDLFLESMAESAKSVSDALRSGTDILYINVMNKLSVDCDCKSNPAEPTMRDIGILASLDPVALDRACVDLVYAAPDGQAVIERIESRNGTHTLDHAEQIGLGSQAYDLISIDA